ncbi:MAG: ATPase [Lachnospiraceae bacterium]|nr:ATPase [Lachnospiraceae bacterium]
MNSRIEQIIDEIEEYIESCKPQMFNGANIVVNKDELLELLGELKAKTPEEIRRYQKIISNKEAILADAKQKADSMVASAKQQESQLISEHQIMQQAYAQANEVVMLATKQAQETIDKATTDANNIRSSAILYTDELLKNLQETLVHCIDANRARNDALSQSLQSYLDVVVNNRSELRPEPSVETRPRPQSAPVQKPVQKAPASEAKETLKTELSQNKPDAQGQAKS